MRAAVLHAPEDLRVEEVPVPRPGPGEVLLRVRACGLCGTDHKIIAGRYPGVWPPEFPFIIGHEWAGEVAALGPGVTTLRVGDRVAAENHSGCGQCGMCRTGYYNLCERADRRDPSYKLYGHTAPGALAEYAVRPAILLMPLPEQVSNVEGALVNPGALALHGLRRTGFHPGCSVAVFGPGVIGLLTVLFARAAGAAQIITVGRGERLSLARELGSTDVVEYDAGDPAQGVRDATGGRGVDYVYECSGNPAAVAQAIGSARRGGKVALLGLTGNKGVELNTDRLTLDQIDVLGVRSSPNMYPDTIALMASGAVRAERLATHRYPLERIGEAVEALRSRSMGAVRVIVEP
ncbi:MAG: alcohol dehydrogenase catalytic domain-containing protein [Chloroflexi bacterium]|nr:alcohol dehydrogenase catalytic domain-containing protein [Chloroflexota bacterium]